YYDNNRCVSRLLTSLFNSVLTLYSFVHTATTWIYTLSLHDALPIWRLKRRSGCCSKPPESLSWPFKCPKSPPRTFIFACGKSSLDRKSTRLNSSHVKISYAVFCLKKKRKITSQENAFAKNTQSFIYL